jgi:hypothetical protein
VLNSISPDYKIVLRDRGGPPPEPQNLPGIVPEEES